MEICTHSVSSVIQAKCLCGVGIQVVRFKIDGARTVLHLKTAMGRKVSNLFGGAKSKGGKVIDDGRPEEPSSDRYPSSSNFAALLSFSALDCVSCTSFFRQTFRYVYLNMSQ